MKTLRIAAAPLLVIAGIFLIISERNSWHFYIYLIKILVILLCMLLVVLTPKSKTSGKYKYAVLAGLAFSLAGDMLLAPLSQIFVAGLLCFLVTHVFYILAFTSNHGFHFSKIILAPLLVYGAVVLYFLKPGLGDLMIPVIVYLLIILTMVWQAGGNYLKTRKKYALVAFVGAVLFILSDSFIAFNKFYIHFENSNVYIIATYFAAQYLIALSVRHAD